MLSKLIRKVSAWTVIFGLAVPWNLVYALPEGEAIVSGSATFDRATPNTLNINQSTDKLITNYNSFSIGAAETVNFIQPSSSSIALNRVVGIDPSTILGKLTATGKIFLVNPNGIVFGQGCRLDTAGMVASTLNITNSDFLAGRYTFMGNGGSVVNQGYISAPGGYVALLGSTVANSGVIEANLGSVVLASGSKTTLDMDPFGIISVVVDDATIANNGKEDAVLNSGNIYANGGKVLLTSKTLDGVFKNAINNSGIIEANSVSGNGGFIELTSSGSGVITTGKIYGNDINLIGDIVRVKNGAEVNASGDDASIYMAALVDYIFLNSSLISASSSTGDAQICLEAKGDINLDKAKVKAFSDKGDASIKMQNNEDYKNINIVGNSEISAEITGNSSEKSKSWSAAEIELKTDGVINIEDSILTSKVNLNGEAKVWFQALGEICIFDSQIYANVLGIGAAGIAAYLDFDDYPDYDGNLNLFDINIYEEIGSPVGGNIIIDNSIISAEAHNVEAADILEDGLFDIGDYGYAGVYFNAAGRIDMNKSTITAKNSNGVCGVGLLSKELINMVDSDVSAIITGDGYSAVGLAVFNFGSEYEAYKDININIDSLSSVKATSLAGASLVLALAQGKINSTGAILAQSGDVESVGVAAVMLLAGGDINVSNVNARGNADVIGWIEDFVPEFLGMDSAVLDIGLADVYSSGILIGSLSGDLTVGNINADAIMLAALGMDEFYTGLYEIPSYDNEKELDYWDLLSTITTMPDGFGAIYSNGEAISGNLLYVLARNDVGTAEKPLETNVNILAGYSFDKGDMYVNEANDIELGLYLPISLTRTIIDDDPNTPEKQTFEVFAGASLAVKDGIIHVVSQDDMIINSVICPNGGVFLQSKFGSMYAGHGWNPFVSADTVRSLGSLAAYLVGYLGFEVDSSFTVDLLGEFLMNDIRSEGGFMTPIKIWTNKNAVGPNIIAGGQSYLSTPVGTIGVGNPDSKDPAVSGQVLGTVDPTVDYYTGNNGPDLDLRFGVPPGYVFYNDGKKGGTVQIWPVDDIYPGQYNMQNPLRVDVVNFKNAKSALPEGFETTAALTLQIGNQRPGPEPVDIKEIYPTVWPKYLRAYYEILSGHRFLSMEPIVPTTFLAYHPISETDMSAFDGINLDAGAYDFISDSLSTKKPMSSYYGS